MEDIQTEQQALLYCGSLNYVVSEIK